MTDLVTDLVTDLGDIEREARARLDRETYAYYASGADDERTVRDNPLAWRRLRLRPHVLADVATVDTATTMLGCEVAMPVGIAPTAAHVLAHPQGERATARGAAAARALYIVSTTATTPLEDIAAAAPDAARWFQLYVTGALRHARDLVERAQASGYRAIVVTADAPAMGARHSERRPLDQRATLAHALPPDLHGTGLVSLTFDDLATITSWTDLPVVVKGVLRSDDAAACARAGAAGVIVSNHGGRQLDTVIDPPSALSEVAAAVGGQIAVYADGGIRAGSDVLKALALGASGVFVGRPVLWALACDGADGVEAVLGRLRDGLSRAMQRCGARTLADISPDLLVDAT